MLSEDYVLRQVGLAAGVVLQLLGLKRKSKADYDEAYSAVDQAMTSLVGLGRTSIPLMDAECIGGCLNGGGWHFTNSIGAYNPSCVELL